MPGRAPRPVVDLLSGGQLGGSLVPIEARRVGRNGQTLAATAEVAPHQSCTIPSRPEELQRLLGASIDANNDLAARVHQLEAALRRSAAELAKLRRELRGARQDALSDPLTGLANRRAFDLALGAIAERASRSSPAQLVMADIDHFKRVNDAHGHATGDEVLRIVGEVILANVRRDGLVARLGGDEFGLLLPEAGVRYAAEIAHRLCQLLASRPLVLRGRPEVTERVTLSIGVAGCHAGESGTRWRARADAALYEAKRRGRNCISIARALELKF